MYRYESLQYGDELRDFFRTKNLPKFIEERFDEIFDGISRLNRSYIMLTFSNFIERKNDYWTHFCVEKDEPEQDVPYINEFLDLLDGYCFLYEVVTVYKTNERAGVWGIKHIDN